MDDRDKLDTVADDVRDIKDAVLGTYDKPGLAPRVTRLEEKETARGKREFALWGLIMAGLSKLWLFR